MVQNFICAEVFFMAHHVHFTMLDLAWLVLSGDGAEGTGLHTCGRTYVHACINK